MHEKEKEFILKCLLNYTNPYLKTDLIKLKLIKSIKKQNEQLTITLIAPYKHQEQDFAPLKQELLKTPSINQVYLQIEPVFANANFNQTNIKLSKIKNIIPVSSGKGGVGKSTVAFNIATSLNRAGFKVGLLDADILGPSIPTLTNTQAHKIKINEQNQFEPILHQGIQVQSIGFLVDPQTAQIWRGLIAVKTLMQLINETNWGDLDYLILDLPPATGDIPLSICQAIKLAGAIIVTTPHDLALADVTKSIAMFNKMEIPIIGLINNMSHYQCPCCDEKHNIFSDNNVEEFAHKQQLNLLQNIPILKKSTQDKKLTDYYDSISNKILAYMHSTYYQEKLAIKINQ